MSFSLILCVGVVFGFDIRLHPLYVRFATESVPILEDIGVIYEIFP